MGQSRRLTQTIARWLALAAMHCFAASDLHAHAELDEQIADITRQIATHGASADRLLHRAELHRRHAEPARAHADLDAVEALKPGWPSTMLARARTWLAEDKPAEGIRAAEAFLKLEPRQPDGLVVRARCRMKLRRVTDAVADYSAAIALIPAPLPDLLLERARAQAALGRINDAVTGLDEGMGKLGGIVSLQLPAIEYERQRANFDGALARVEEIAARYPRKEPWLALRGEILEQAGRLAEACAAFRGVISGIETYPPVRRNLDLTQQLETRAREGLARVETRSKTAMAVIPMR